MQSESMNAIDVAYQTEVAIENKSTEQLTIETNTFYRQAEQLAGMSAAMLAEAGRRLIEVKSRVPHGEFTEWCENNLEFSYRKASRMMQLAKKMDDENSIFSKMPTSATIEISRVWELLAAPEEVAAEVIENNDIENITVKELRAELARVKEEKEAAERKAKMIDHNNDDIRKELASMQRKLSESVSEEKFTQMQEAAQAQKEDLAKELNEAKATAAEIQVKLDKAKEDLKKQKAKQKELEASKEEDIKKRVAEAGKEFEDKIRADAQKEAENALKEKTDTILSLEAQVSALEAEKAKLSNTRIMTFKVLTDQLQEVLSKIADIIEEQNDEDPAVGSKMTTGLKAIAERWIP